MGNTPGMEHNTENSATGCLPVTHWEASYRGHQGCQLPLKDFRELSGSRLSKTAFLPEGYALKPRKSSRAVLIASKSTQLMTASGRKCNQFALMVVDTAIQTIPTVERPGSVFGEKAHPGKTDTHGIFTALRGNDTTGC